VGVGRGRKGKSTKKEFWKKIDGGGACDSTYAEVCWSWRADEKYKGKESTTSKAVHRGRFSMRWMISPKGDCGGGGGKGFSPGRTSQEGGEKGKMRREQNRVEKL